MIGTRELISLELFMTVDSKMVLGGHLFPTNTSTELKEQIIPLRALASCHHFAIALREMDYDMCVSRAILSVPSVNFES